MTFTKTERALFDAARRHPYGVVSTSHGLQGPSGRKRSFGVREHNAAVKLRDKGLLVRVHGDGGTPLYKNGWGQNGVVYTSTWKLTDKAKGVA